MVKMNIKFEEDIARWKDVNDEEEGPQDRTLRHT